MRTNADNLRKLPSESEKIQVKFFVVSIGQVTVCATGIPTAVFVNETAALLVSRKITAENL